MPLVVTNSAEQLEGGLEIGSNLTYGSQIATSVAVVGSTPHGDHILVGEVILIALVHQLMSASNQRKIVDMAELVRYSITE